VRRAWAIVALVAACQPAAAPSIDIDLPGVDTHTLVPSERHTLGDLLTQELAPCPEVAVPVGQCVRERRACNKCVPAAQFLVKAVLDGLTNQQIDQMYKVRFDPSAAKTIPVDGSPFKGPGDAPVVLVEFADFECPHCAAVAPVLDATWAEHKDRVRFVYKFLPLPMHAHAEIAARAAIAAGDQGKFWEMHDLLFSNAHALERTNLDAYAQQLALDMKKFAADFDSPETSSRLSQDLALADALDIHSTPTIYVNGRQFDGKTALADWLSSSSSK
jgi:protein-disulfide isomerase